ncbi:FecR family protein [Albibacterium indicum]|uniref:FecR family protein n=1 Tax=Albibacterium indicum TaxID=2292082 RepID=UPI0013EF0E7A|nr:FecR family protein [Pedobacter indicus]
MNKKNAEELINKYLEGTCSPEEKSLVERWYNHATDEHHLMPSNRNIDEIGDEIFQRLPVKRKSRISIFYRSIVAAVFLAATTFVINSFLKDQNEVAVIDRDLESILPGGNKAYLTLEDGSRVLLDELDEGKSLQQLGVSISKTEEGQLVYSIDEKPESEPKIVRYNTISTPRGGQYQILLPDGTKVWLNAESSLTYPTTFSSLGERKVVLRGEAYFEVMTNEKMPFLVHAISPDSSLSQNIEVLGTHFNINAYGDGGILKTTLVEGSVKVRSGDQQAILKPNQQSNVDGNNLNIKNMDADVAIAWKNGYFMFEDERIEDIMLRIARWYDVEVDFQHVDKTQVFSGTISKFEDVKSVLNLLELTGGVHFKIQQKKIIVN